MGTPSINAYWPLGNNGQDLAPGGSHPVSSFNGSTTTVQCGPFANKGSRLVGGNLSTDYIDCGQNVTIREKSTTSFWIKWVNLQTGGDGGYAHGIISRRDPGSVNGTFQVYYIDSRGTESIRVSFRDSTTFRLKSANITTPLIADKWYHFAITFDARTAGNTNFYLNGKKLDISSDQVQTEAWVDTPGSTNIRIGYSANSANNFNGYISEVALIGRLLSADEIKSYYDSCINPTKPRLALQTPFLGYTGAITEAATATDTIEGHQVTKWSSITEAAIAEDSVTGRNTYHHPLVIEVAQAADIIDAYNISKNIHLTETAIAQDSATIRSSSSWPTVIETAIASDTIAANFEFTRSVTEEATALDSVIGVIPKWLELTEGAVATDTLAFQHTYTSAAHSGFYTIYLAGRIRATIFQKYRQDYDCTEKVFIQPVRETYTVWISVRLLARQLNTIENVHLWPTARQTYDLTYRAIFRRTWAGGLHKFTYNILQYTAMSTRQYTQLWEKTPVSIKKREFYIVRDNDNLTENISYTYQVWLDSANVTSKVKTCQVNYSLSQYTGECSIVWADPTMYTSLDPLTNMGAARLEVYTAFRGLALVKQGTFMIEKRSVSIDNTKTYPTSWGRTLTAKLASPHALPITKSWDNDTKALTIALEVMQMSQPTITLLWQIADYTILGGNFVATSEEPISLIGRLAAPLGGIVTTNKLGNLVVRYQYV